MGGTEMMVASIAMSGLQTMGRNSAARSQQRDRDQTAADHVAELKRQQDRADLIAQEEKSDVSRAFDLELGSMIAAAADGGVTKAALARAGGAAGAIAGLDTARIESNRQEGQNQRRAESVAIIRENQAQRKQTKANIFNNTLSFFGNAVGTLAKSDFAFNSTPTTTPSQTSGGSSLMPGEWDSSFRNKLKRPVFSTKLS